MGRSPAKKWSAKLETHIGTETVPGLEKTNTEEDRKGAQDTSVSKQCKKNRLFYTKGNATSAKTDIHKTVATETEIDKV